MRHKTSAMARCHLQFASSWPVLICVPVLWWHQLWFVFVQVLIKTEGDVSVCRMLHISVWTFYFVFVNIMLLPLDIQIWLCVIFVVGFVVLYVVFDCAFIYRCGRKITPPMNDHTDMEKNRLHILYFFLVFWFFRSDRYKRISRC